MSLILAGSISLQVFIDVGKLFKTPGIDGFGKTAFFDPFRVDEHEKNRKIPYSSPK